jgi:hypothetical protein
MRREVPGRTLRRRRVALLIIRSSLTFGATRQCGPIHGHDRVECRDRDQRCGRRCRGGDIGVSGVHDELPEQQVVPGVLGKPATATPAPPCATSAPAPKPSPTSPKNYSTSADTTADTPKISRPPTVCPTLGTAL